MHGATPRVFRFEMARTAEPYMINSVRSIVYIDQIYYIFQKINKCIQIVNVRIYGHGRHVLVPIFRPTTHVNYIV